MTATGTRRMLRALGCDGYSAGRIGAELGVRPSAVRAWQLSSQINPDHMRAVADLYRRWAGVPAETNGSTPTDAERTRALARRRRWAPSGSWDGEDITDPDAVPAPRRSRRPAADVLEDSEEMLRRGQPLPVVAEDLGLTVASLKRIRTRARAQARARERAAASAAPPPT